MNAYEIRGNSVYINETRPLTEVTIGGRHITSFKVGDFIHIRKEDNVVMVTREWVDQVTERIAYLDGLTERMSRDLETMRGQMAQIHRVDEKQ